METLQRAANRGSISTGYDIDNSLKLESDNSETLYKENINGNRRTWTTSWWFKRTELTGGTTQHLLIHGVFTNALRVFISNEFLYMDIADASGTYYRFISNQVFRDTSAWYHIVWRVDTTSATATERARIYINGEEITWGTEPTVPQNYDTLANFANAQIDEIQFSYRQASNYQNSYIAEFHHVDGQSLAPTEFGEFDSDTGIWKPIEYTGTYGTNGCYLDFSNSGSLGADSSGNGNDFTLSNITSADQATDTPTNNFCTMTSVANFYWEPKTRNATNGGTWITDSNVTNNWTGTMCTTPLFTGKWYWEVYMFQPAEQMCGIHDFTGNVGSTTSTPHPYQLGRSWTVYGGGANWIKSIYGTDTTGTSEPAFSNNTIVGVALDLDNHLLTFYKNGFSAGTNLTNIDISSLTDTYPGPWMPFVGVYRNSLQTNFGGFPGFTISSGNTDDNGYGNFEYAPPSGFLAICSKNLAES